MDWTCHIIMTLKVNKQLTNHIFYMADETKLKKPFIYWEIVYKKEIHRKMIYFSVNFFSYIPIPINKFYKNDKNFDKNFWVWEQVPNPSTHYRNSLLYSHKDVVKMPHKPIYIQKKLLSNSIHSNTSEWSTRF